MYFVADIAPATELYAAILISGLLILVFTLARAIYKKRKNRDIRVSLFILLMLVGSFLLILGSLAIIPGKEKPNHYKLMNNVKGDAVACQQILVTEEGVVGEPNESLCGEVCSEWKDYDFESITTKVLKETNDLNSESDYKRISVYEACISGKPDWIIIKY